MRLKTFIKHLNFERNILNIPEYVLTFQIDVDLNRIYDSYDNFISEIHIIFILRYYNTYRSKGGSTVVYIIRTLGRSNPCNESQRVLVGHLLILLLLATTLEVKICPTKVCERYIYAFWRFHLRVNYYTKRVTVVIHILN